MVCLYTDMVKKTRFSQAGGRKRVGKTLSSRAKKPVKISRVKKAFHNFHHRIHKKITHLNKLKNKHIRKIIRYQRVHKKNLRRLAIKRLPLTHIHKFYNGFQTGKDILRQKTVVVLRGSVRIVMAVPGYGKKAVGFGWFHSRRFVRRHRKALAGTLSLFLLACGSFYYLVIKDLPPPQKLASVAPAMTTIIRDRNGKVLYKVYKSANRISLPWEEIPDIVKKATIAIEDANFYNHRGVSIKSIVRAAIHNLSQEDVKAYQGGSTLTQQLVKNRLLSPEKTYSRKIKEIILAVWSEFVYSKKEILTMYLNEVGYGGPAYGIEAASEMYFGLPVGKLDLAQTAFLAGLPAAPTTFSPFGENPELSYIRQQDVLDRMLKLKMITEDEYARAMEEKIVFAPQKIDILAPHFVMYIKQVLVQNLGEAVVTEGGLDVTTTLDLSVQEKAEEIVRNQISQIKDKYKIRNAGALVTNPSNGEILAMVGSPDYFDISNKGYVNTTTSYRQPGSAIKPVNYSYAFEHGYTPGSTIEDSPVSYTAKGSTEVYTPKNYDGKYHGVVTLRSALANSYNIPAVKLLNKNGVPNMIEQGKKMGIRSWNNLPPVGLSLTLGAAEVTMLDMARVYGTLANLGVYKDIKAIKEIKNNRKEDITSLFYSTEKEKSLIGSVEAKENTQAVSQIAAYWVTDILADNVARLPAFGPYAKLTIPNHKVAVKTGTSNEFRDNWTIGYTPDFLTAVWVGNNDGSFMNKNLVSGITGAAPIWNEIMTNLLANVPDKEFAKPEGMVPVKICAVNGLLTCPNCPSEKTEYFMADKVPTKKCFFRPSGECAEAKKQAEGKSDEEKKKLLSGCYQ